MSTTINVGTITSLAAKLDSLDLADDERAALQALLSRAADAGDHVEGYGVVFQVETTIKADPAAVKNGQPMGFNIGMPPTVRSIARGLGVLYEEEIH